MHTTSFGNRQIERGLLQRFFVNGIVAIVLAMGVFPIAAAAQTTDLGGFDIRSFEADIAIESDASVRVVEDILIRFHEQRHGIFRNIPIEYTTESGNTMRVRLDVLEVKQNGRAAMFEEYREGDDIVVKIGDPDAYVKGDVAYQIVYDATRVLLYEGNDGADGATDELYWNVTGTAWPVVPRLVRATVRMPDGIREMDIEKSCYTGDYGSVATNCAMNVVRDGERFVVKAEANDFLTVAVRMPAGYIARPSVWQRMLWFITDNKVVALPVVLFMLLFAYWYREGRDPASRAIVTEFAPPHALTPAEIGVLEDGKMHDRELSATIVDLAVRGYLKIIEAEEDGIFGKKRTFTIQKTGKSLDDIREYERLVVQMILGDAESRELGSMQSRAAEIKRYRDEVSEILYTSMAEQKWFVRNPEKVRNAFVGTGVTIIFVSFWIVMSMSVSWALSLVACGVMIALFGLIMPKRTEQGTRLYEHVKGFKEYLSRAEKYRLEWQEKEGIFEKFLPYAMVFLVADKWTTALASTVSEPTWYVGSRPGVWDAYVFNAAMNDLHRDLNTAVMTAPQSKASSGGSGIGGGFSGGGFGGGGGGSW